MTDARGANTPRMTTGEQFRPADLEMFERLGIPPNLLDAAQIRRVTHQQAREDIGIRYRSDRLEGVYYPNLDPERGDVRGGRVRRDHPELDSGGRPIAKYIGPPDRRYLYFTPGAGPLLTDMSVSIVIVETEKSALAFTAAAARASRHVLAIATGGCWSWRGVVGKTTDPAGARVDEKGPLPDLTRVAWSARDVVILFDANLVTNPKVRAARRALAQDLARRGASVRIAELLPEPDVNGPDDYRAKHGDAALLALLDNAKSVDDLAAESSPKLSQATRLVDLAHNSGIELWHTPGGDPYATIHVTDHREHHALTSRALRDWLGRLYHVKTGCTSGGQAIADALTTLSGIARYDGSEYAVSVRVAGQGEAIYLDLGRPDWRVVEITPAGWKLIADPPVRLRRPRGLLPLPVPETGGSLAALHELLHLADEDDHRLVVAWLIGALRPTGPYPVLDLCGEQGSAKSTAARMLRRLIDPSLAELRAEPREVRDLMIAASSGWIVSLDNVSHLTPWLSDALCRLSTGGALSTRQLYTDGDEHIIEAIRPVLLNGISDIVQRGDLQDRAISITLPPITDPDRRAEAEVWRAFDAAAPGILGALLDAAVVALRRWPTVRPAALPRIADWARWTTAAEPACGWSDGDVLRAYRASRQAAIEANLDGDLLATAIRGLPLPWTGTASDLLARLTPADRRPARRWPESPRGLSAALRRLAPQLRRVAIVIETTREAHTGRRLISVDDGSVDRPSPPSPSSPDLLPRAKQGDDAVFDRHPIVTQPSPDADNGSGLGDGGDGGDGVAPFESACASAADFSATPGTLAPDEGDNLGGDII